MAKSIIANFGTENSKRVVKSEFRLTEGKLFWHSCPKKYADESLHGMVKQNNACLGEAETMDEETIRTMLQAYLETMGCTETWTLNIVGEKTFGERTPKTTAEPKPCKPRTPKTAAEPVSEPAPETIAEPSVTEPSVTEPSTEDAPETIAEPVAEAATEDVEDALLSEDDVQLVMALRRMRAGTMDEAAVEKIVLKVLAKFGSDETVAPRIKRAAKKAAKKTDEIRCKDFDDMAEDLADGFFIYLVGPAGTGKSHTAEQLAAELGLDFYTQTTVQFAHDVRGYGDAGGNYIGTPFYEAFSKGGLFFQDEYDRSFAEAAIVQNTALANGYYDFPVVGRVKAHPNFRFMAAGNTLMAGADEEYVTGQVLDASSRDRFSTYYYVDYDKRIELKIANGDSELVDFMFDVRQSIKKCGIKHVVSYRATKYLAARNNTPERMKRAIERALFKGLNKDDMRVIYGQLKNQQNTWAVQLGEIVK